MRGRAVPVGEVDADRRRAMLRLLDAHFLDIRERQFRADLEAKDWVVLLEDDEGALAGFSTLRVGRFDVGGVSHAVLDSGDTIVAQGHRGSPLLARTWIATVRELERRLDLRDLHWLLICSGFRTYRFLPVFFRRFHPRYDQPTSAATQALVDALARARYGDAYDRARGVVTLVEPQPLRPELATVPSGRLRDPHVQFFLERNPGHHRGDELVCYCSLADSNLTAAGHRMVGHDPRHSGGSRLEKGTESC